MAISRFLRGVALTMALAIVPVCAFYPSSLHPVPRLHAAREAELVRQAFSDDDNTVRGRPSYNFSVPVDHFHNETKYEPHSNASYNLRYWIDDTYYKPGGPVILLASGEVSSVLRLRYLEHGIGKILAQATHGLTVVLEHRYYGTSYPVPDLSTENMRFLSTEQALADTAYFVRNIRYPGLEKYNLTSHETPYIAYGGSYAGTFVALLRKIYPDDFWGAISGSGVPYVHNEYWQYLEAFRLFGDPACVEMSQKITRVLDRVLGNPDRTAADRLKGFFGLTDLADDDFAYYINQGPMGLQGTMWDPEEDSPLLAEYCAVITSDRPLYASTLSIHDNARHALLLAGYYDETGDFLPRFLNWIGHNRKRVQEDAARCEKLGKSAYTDDDGDDDRSPTARCFSKRGALDDISIPQGVLRPWTYQTCTQWGFFVTGSGVPRDQLPLMSRLVDLDYATLWCPEAFGIPADPDRESINRYGGLSFSHSRLAFIDGEHDPWRPAGVHAIGENKDRESTDSEPFILIEGGVHHWDEYGARPHASGSWLPPPVVAETQEEEVRFVKLWLEEYAEARSKAAPAEEKHQYEEL